MPRKTSASQIAMNIIDLRGDFIRRAFLCEEDIKRLDELLKAVVCETQNSCAAELIAAIQPEVLAEAAQRSQKSG